MAKELPYYQFEVAEYLAGDIMICSLEAQGLFAIIKCIYWQKECSLNISKIIKRFDKNELIEELTEEGAIKINDDGDITISFLDIQYQSFKQRRDKLSEAGKKGGLIKKKATLKPPLSEAKATLKHIEKNREEENREEENRVDKNREDKTKNKQLLKDVCDFFNVNEIKNFNTYKAIHTFVMVSGIDPKTFEAYKQYKEQSNEITHGWRTFIGDPENKFSDGAWAACDWLAKIKDIPKSKNGIPEEPDQIWIKKNGQNADLWMEACRKWRANGWQYKQQEGATIKTWKQTNK